MTVGILALQGDVREHGAALAEVGVAWRRVRRPDELPGLSALVLPGGESTTLSLLLQSSGLFEPLARLLADGLPVLGTCAGLVLLASEVLDGRPDQRSLGLLACTVRRNGYGRQLQSFEGSVDVAGPLASPGGGTTMPAVFIRAPVIEAVGTGVEVLGRLGGPAPGGQPVAVRQGSVLATAFHPELTADRRVHRLLATLAGEVPAPPPAVGAAVPGGGPA